MSKFNLETIAEKPMRRARQKIWDDLKCDESVKRANDNLVRSENSEQFWLDQKFQAEQAAYNQHRTRLNQYNGQLNDIINKHRALIDDSTVLPPSFKDERSIVYIYRELKDGLSDTLKEAKQRCEAKKDTEDFRKKVMNAIECGFSSLDSHLSAQMSAAMAQLERSQSRAFSELQAQQNRYAIEQSAKLNEQSRAIESMASKNASYLESAKRNDEKMRESLKKIQEGVKKNNDFYYY